MFGSAAASSSKTDASEVDLMKQISELEAKLKDLRRDYSVLSKDHVQLVTEVFMVTGPVLTESLMEKVVEHYKDENATLDGFLHLAEFEEGVKNYARMGHLAWVRSDKILQ